MDEKKESEKKFDEMTADMEKKDKSLDDGEQEMNDQRKLYSDLDFENQQTIRAMNSLQQNYDELNRAFDLEQEARDQIAAQLKELKKVTNIVFEPICGFCTNQFQRLTYCLSGLRLCPRSI